MRAVLTGLLRAIAGGLLCWIFTMPAAAQSAATAPYSIRFVYLVPSDRPVKSAYRDAIALAAWDAQRWLAYALDGPTFDFGMGPVAIVRSEKPARWFSSAEPGAGFGAFYRNTAEELKRLGIARTSDATVRTVVYVDADHVCGQSGAAGGALAVVSANDLRGLVGETIVPACERANPAEVAGRCRWVGGLVHELLHTFGLRHPDRSPACQSPQCRAEALMMQGFMRYPRARLLDEEKEILLRSPFIAPRRIAASDGCEG